MGAGGVKPTKTKTWKGWVGKIKEQLNVFATNFLNISKYGWLILPSFYGQQNLAKNNEIFFGFTIRFYHHVFEKIPGKKMATFGVVSSPRVAATMVVVIIHNHLSRLCFSSKCLSMKVTNPLKWFFYKTFTWCYLSHVLQDKGQGMKITIFWY